jgi:hypothetical protein
VFAVRYEYHLRTKSKGIPVTGRGDLQGREMLSIAHCLDNKLTDSSEGVGLKHRPLSTPLNHYFSVSGTHFL